MSGVSGGGLYGSPTSGQVKALAGAAVRPVLGSQVWDGNRAFSSADAAVLANTLYIAPWVCPETTSYDALQVRITTGTAGNCKLGVMKLNLTTLVAELVAETSGDLSTAAVTALVGTFPAPVPLEAGNLYGLCFVTDATPAVRGYNAGSIQGAGFSWLAGSTTAGKWNDSSGNYNKLVADLTYVTATPMLPASTVMTYGAGAPGAPIMGIRKA